MKINKIEIKDFRQFKDFSLDLSYPKGHDKEGQPLDRVCFIGQSGTGKTTLLEVIKRLVKSNYPTEIRLRVDDEFGEDKDFWGYEGRGIMTFSIKGIQDRIIFNVNPKDSDIDSAWEDRKKLKLKETYLREKGNILYYFPAEMLWSFQDFSGINIQEFESGKFSEEEVERAVKFYQKLGIVDFSKIDPLNIWQFILIDLIRHREAETEQRIALSKVAETNSNNGDEIQKSVAEFNRWKDQNPSPVIALADALDPIIKSFNTRIKRTFDFKKAQDIFSLQLETLQGDEIPIDIWSTGTKQLILSAVPLIQLPTSECILLFDEPERSLYPDKQAEIVDFYTNIASDSQFFFATHSPIVASSFEPWEIVELKFDEEGKVNQEVYFEGENHVDNYHTDPRYYNYGTVLKNIFDLKQEGGDSEFRLEKLMKASSLKEEIKILNEEGEKEKAKELYEEFKGLADKLDWQLTNK